MNNFKQRNGFTQVKGAVSPYLNAMRLKKDVFKNLNQDMRNLLYQLGYSDEKIDMAVHKPEITGVQYNQRLKAAYDKSEIHAIVYLISGRNHMNKLTPKIEELWMKD